MPDQRRTLRADRIMDLRTSRRTDRLNISIPIQVSGADTAGAAFSETTRTLVISGDGAAILLQRYLAPEQQITIRRENPPKQADAKVVQMIGEHAEGAIYGVELLGEAAGFWEIDFTEIAEESETVGRVVLECETCHRRQVAHVGMLAAGVLELTHRMSHFCNGCGKITVWNEALPVPKVEEARAHLQVSAIDARGRPVEVVPLAVGPSTTVSGEKLPAPDEVARAMSQVNVNLTACIRSWALKDEIVTTESAGSAGLSFKSRKVYSEGTRIEIAIPYRASQPAIFVPARIIRLEKGADGATDYFAAYVKNFVTKREADGSISITERTAAAPQAGPPAPKKVDLKKAAIPAALAIAALAVLIFWSWGNSERPAITQTAASNPAAPSASGSVAPTATTRPSGIGGDSVTGGGGSGLDINTTTPDAPLFEMDYQLNDGKLVVAGRTDLPDGSTLEIDIYSGPTLVATDAPVSVQGRGFSSRPMLSRGVNFTPGKFRVRIQPAKAKPAGRLSAINLPRSFQFSSEFSLSQ